MKIFAPGGRKIFDVVAVGNLGEIGISEMFFEGEEPSLDELPLDEFLELFPEGIYRFFGETTEGVPLRGRARFTHNIPDGPVIVSPGEGEVVDPDNTEIRSEPVTTPAGIEMAGYEVIVGRFDIIIRRRPRVSWCRPDSSSRAGSTGSRSWRSRSAATRRSRRALS